MDRLDFLLFTAFTPVFCLTFLIVIDAYTAFASRMSLRSFRKYSAHLVPVAPREEALNGRRHA